MNDTPTHLYTARCLRALYDVSWHKLGIRVARGEIVPHAVTTGPTGNTHPLFHPDQIPQIVKTCRNVPKPAKLRARMAQEALS